MKSHNGLSEDQNKVSDFLKESIHLYICYVWKSSGREMKDIFLPLYLTVSLKKENKY